MSRSRAVETAEQWVRSRIEALVARRQTPELQPQRGPRYVLKDEAPPPPLPRPAPANVPEREWAVACANVLNGSAPCLLSAKQLGVNDKVLLGMAAQSARPSPPSPPPPSPTIFPSRFWK